MSFSVYDITKTWVKDYCDVTAVNETTSTNDFAKKEGFLKKPTLFITDHQTHGRGRNENSWSNSQNGHQLLCSFSCPLKAAPQKLTAPIIGLAIYKALKSQWPNLAFHIKAPNDIYLKDKKIGGLLIEALSQGEQFQVILGFGLNVFSAPSSEEISGHLSSDISQEDWQSFLKFTYDELLKSIRNITYEELNPQDQADLTEALKPHYTPDEGFQNISPGGNLIFKDKTVPWSDV